MPKEVMECVCWRRATMEFYLKEASLQKERDYLTSTGRKLLPTLYLH